MGCDLIDFEPAEWEDALARLARERAGELLKLAEQMEAKER
jgi:hypothetical protein